MYFIHSFILQTGWYGVQGSYADVTEAGLKIKLPTPHNHDAVPFYWPTNPKSDLVT